jgi:hypothetical protein
LSGLRGRFSSRFPLENSALVTRSRRAGLIALRAHAGVRLVGDGGCEGSDDDEGHCCSSDRPAMRASLLISDTDAKVN